ncbi:DUF4244 domain-containing protein [Amycolatopsis sp. 195334CR]|uniref:DUF4244 domain-containing protein n=1 Tax=Amycolatopsis sp. 195334CR TaxID=2814588 RepID=UPI001A8C4180|nr:DUF4244 domain-containing protein [Amycolatopsis sp. 195334CR]MBN6035122.1 DUF4244 domain-containing protein [Amycolatopsis sp. 195334CR]
MILNEAHPDAGSVTIELALVTVALIALAGLLYVVLTNGTVEGLLTSVVEDSLEERT